MAEYFDPDTGEILNATITDTDIQSLADLSGVDFDTAAQWLSEGLTPDFGTTAAGEPVEVDRSTLDYLTDEEFHRYFAGELLSGDGLHMDSGFSGGERHYEESFSTLGEAVDHAERLIVGDEGAFFSRAIEDMRLTQNDYGDWVLEWDTYDPVGEEWYE